MRFACDVEEECMPVYRNLKIETRSSNLFYFFFSLAVVRDDVEIS